MEQTSRSLSIYSMNSYSKRSENLGLYSPHTSLKGSITDFPVEYSPPVLVNARVQVNTVEEEKVNLLSVNFFENEVQPPRDQARCKWAVGKTPFFCSLTGMATGLTLVVTGLFLHERDEQEEAICAFTGGGAMFLTGLFLSIYNCKRKCKP